MYPTILIRSVTYLLVIAFTVLIFKWAAPIFVTSTGGIVLPEQKINVSNKSDKAVRLLPFSPNKFKNLGQINIEMHVKSAKENQESIAKKTEEYAKKLAAELGADAIVVTSYGITSFGEAAADSNFYVFRGTAIHLDETSL